MNLIDKILEEWAYRVHDGMPDPKNPLHIIDLEESLNELNALDFLDLASHRVHDMPILLIFYLLNSYL